MIKESIAGVGGDWDGRQSVCGSIICHNIKHNHTEVFLMTCIICANLCAK